MDEKKVKLEKEGECSKFIQYEDGTWSFETKYRDYRADNSSYASKAVSFLTTFGLIDAFNEIDEEYYDKFTKLLNSAKSLQDLDDLEVFLNDNTGLSSIVDDFIDDLHDYIDAYRDIIVNNNERGQNEEINNKENELNKLDLESYSSLSSKKEKLDMIADELLNKQYADPEEYYELAREYDIISYDLERLVKLGKEKEETIEEINKSCKNQSNKFKTSAKKIDEISDIIKTI